MKAITFREMEGYAFEIVLAAEARVQPDVRRQFVAKFRLGYCTEYVLRDHGRDVFKSDNWREALVEYNYGDVAGTLGEAASVPAVATPEDASDVRPIAEKETIR